MGRAGLRSILMGILVLALSAGLLAACGGDKADDQAVVMEETMVVAEAPAPEAYKIGGIFAVTGPAAFLGDPEKKSMMMAAELINAKGGIDGRQVEVIIYDTEGDPTKAVQFANRLISKDKVDAIVGPSRTPTTMPVIPICEQAQVPLISCAAGVGIVLPVKPWVFKTAQSDTLAVSTIYRQMKKAGIAKVALICVDNSFGQSGREQLKALAPNFGIEVVADETFGGQDTDMTPQLTKIREAGPDAIVCWGTNPGPAVVAKNAKQLQLNIPLYMSHGVASPKFIALAGDAAEGILLPTGNVLVAKLLPAGYHQRPTLMDYIDQYEAKYQTSVSGFGGYAWDAMKILEQALVGADGDKARIRANIETLTGMVGVSGTFNFSPEDHNGLGDDAFSMVRIHNGTWELL